MEKIVRQFILLRYVQNRNRKGEYPNFIEIARKMFSYIGGEYDKQKFERDKKALLDKNCGLEYDSKEKGYYYNEEGKNKDNPMVDDLITNYMFLTAQNKEALLPSYVITETRLSTGVEYLLECMRAIETSCELQISYYDYRIDKVKSYTIQPYRLKHKDYKWYLLAVDVAHPEVPFKSFALERFRSLDEGKPFRKNEELDFETPYRDAFGMFTDAQAERLVLEFDHRDGNYLIASPIHSSQKVIRQTPKHITFELYVKLTLDLIMELMRRSWSLTIIEPEHLREEFLNYWKEAIKRNKKVKSEK